MSNPTCPICDEPFQPGDLLCMSCGANLARVGGAHRHGPTHGHQAPQPPGPGYDAPPQQYGPPAQDAWSPSPQQPQQGPAQQDAWAPPPQQQPQPQQDAWSPPPPVQQGQQMGQPDAQWGPGQQQAPAPQWSPAQGGQQGGGADWPPAQGGQQNADAGWQQQGGQQQAPDPGWPSGGRPGHDAGWQQGQQGADAGWQQQGQQGRDAWQPAPQGGGQAADAGWPPAPHQQPPAPHQQGHQHMPPGPGDHPMPPAPQHGGRPVTPPPHGREATLLPPDEPHQHQHGGDSTAFMCPHCEAVLSNPAAAQCDVCLRPVRQQTPVLRVVFPSGELKISVGQHLVLGRDAGQSPVASTFTQYDNVSRRHSTVWLDPSGTAWVRDEGSTNGTFVNGERLPRGVEAPLRHGDELRLAADVAGTVQLS
ncbi:FHA domain-containing protein [Thermomonospora amylolytica]|uniref:FHA domain-containing protein n=1 Tax=Thermomonospora amylolytica TaxID=1411117 RepID=UPI000E6CE030|nr:FHA domain-containing protein [Thermomonospora amylolytica]